MQHGGCGEVIPLGAGFQFSNHPCILWSSKQVLRARLWRQKEVVNAVEDGSCFGEAKSGR